MLPHESLGKGCSRLKTKDHLGQERKHEKSNTRICRYCLILITDRFAKNKRAPWHEDCRQKELARRRELRKNGSK